MSNNVERFKSKNTERLKLKRQIKIIYFILLLLLKAIIKANRSIQTEG